MRAGPARNSSRAPSTTHGRRGVEAVRRGQLRGHRRDAPRIGAVRTRARLLHRRRRGHEGPVRAGARAAPSSSTRSARRRRRSRSSCCARSRRARCGRSARAAPVKIDVRVVGRHQRRSRRGPLRRDGSGRISTTASSVVVIAVPPLRERRADIPLPDRRVPARTPAHAPGAIAGCRADALEVLRNHPWPGNVRELENTIERAGAVQPGHGDRRRGSARGPGPAPASRRGAAVRGTADARRGGAAVPRCTSSRRSTGNRTRAAEVLGIDRRTLYRMAERFGIDLDRRRRALSARRQSWGASRYAARLPESSAIASIRRCSNSASSPEKRWFEASTIHSRFGSRARAISRRIDRRRARTRRPSSGSPPAEAGATRSMIPATLNVGSLRNAFRQVDDGVFPSPARVHCGRAGRGRRTPDDGRAWSPGRRGQHGQAGAFGHADQDRLLARCSVRRGRRTRG